MRKTHLHYLYRLPHPTSIPLAPSFSAQNPIPELQFIFIKTSLAPTNMNDRSPLQEKPPQHSRNSLSHLQPTMPRGRATMPMTARAHGIIARPHFGILGPPLALANFPAIIPGVLP